MFVALALLALAADPSTADAAATDVMTDAPEIRRAQSILCRCAKATPAQFLLEGLVIDAEVSLGADPRKAADRQATIFNVVRATAGAARADIKGRTKIFHSTNETACGVVFDYGKRYAVPVTLTEEGVYETGYCLVNADRFGESEVDVQVEVAAE